MTSDSKTIMAEKAESLNIIRKVYHWINGQIHESDSDRYGEVFDSATGEQCAEVVMANEADVNIYARGNLSVDEIRDLAIDAEQKIIDMEDIELLGTWSNSGGSTSSMRGNSSDKVGGMFVDFYSEDNAVSDRNGYEIFR